MAFLSKNTWVLLFPLQSRVISGKFIWGWDLHRRVALVTLFLDVGLCIQQTVVFLECAKVDLQGRKHTLPTILFLIFNFQYHRTKDQIFICFIHMIRDGSFRSNWLLWRSPCDTLHHTWILKLWKEMLFIQASVVVLDVARSFGGNDLNKALGEIDAWELEYPEIQAMPF